MFYDKEQKVALHFRTFCSLKLVRQVGNIKVLQIKWIIFHSSFISQIEQVQAKETMTFSVLEMHISCDALQAILIWLKSLSLITWDINPCIASMVVLQLKNKHKFNVGPTVNWTVILFEDIQLFWKFRVPITPWILKTVQKGKVKHSNLAIVANSFLLLKSWGALYT